MSLDDNERAEQGDKKKVNGSEYSVVGDTVYEKNFWGNWKPVENSQDAAEAGDKRDVNGTDYSVVGNTVYEKNFWGNWKAVDDPQERARAGEQSQSRGSDYSKVGDTVYEKNLWGNWKESTDPQERAEAGDRKTVNGAQYSVVGDTVYEKNLLGNWKPVEDLQDVAKAGHIHNYNGSEYSSVGNHTYVKSIFGNWSEISPKEAAEIPGLQRPVKTLPNDNGNGSHGGGSSGGGYSSSGNSDNSSSGSLVGTFLALIFGVIAVIIIISVFNGSFHSIFANSNGPVSAPAQVVPAPAPETPQPQVQEAAQVPSNPFGEGNGKVGFFINCYYCGKFEILEDTVDYGAVPEPRLAANRDWDAPDVLGVQMKAGSHVITVRKDDGTSWQQTVEVTLGEGVMVNVQDPPPNSEIRTDTKNESSEVNEAAAVEPSFQILSPDDHATFGFPRYTDVQWAPYDGADTYEVQLELSNAPYDYTASSFSPMPYSNGGVYVVTGTTVTVQGMGKQVHRLRVLAIKSGQIVSTTPWRYFNYSN